MRSIVVQTNSHHVLILRRAAGRRHTWCQETRCTVLQLVDGCGEPAGTRTQGPRLKRAMLYRLSYRLTIRMLKKGSRFILALLRTSTSRKGYAWVPRSLRPRWKAFLNILKLKSTHQVLNE